MKILTIAVSLIFMYFLASTLVSIVLELIIRILNKRSSHLGKQLTAALGEDCAHKIMADPSVAYKSGAKGKPQTMDSKAFSKAMANALSEKDATGTTESSKTETTTADAAEGDTKTKQKTSTQDDSLGGFKRLVAGKEGEEAEKPLEDWYNSFVDNTKKEFGRKMLPLNILVSLLVVVLLNLDTIRVCKALWNDDDLSEQALKIIQGTDLDAIPAGDHSDTSDSLLVVQMQQVLAQLSTLEEAGLPIGWKSCKSLGLNSPARDSSFSITLTAKKDTTGKIIKYELPRSGLQYAPTKLDNSTLSSEFKPEISAATLKPKGNDWEFDLKTEAAWTKDSILTTLESLDDITAKVKITFHIEAECCKSPGFIGGNTDSGTIPGWLITILATSMGASFWRDLLKKLLSLLSRKGGNA